jgi:succinoglycan biosynthesis transport protein ExoP
MNLNYLLNSLLKRKWIILGATLVTLIVTAFFLLTRGKIYQSTAQYSTGFTIQQVSLVNEEFNIYEADTKFNNVLETFKSPKVVGILGYSLLLHDISSPDNPFRRPAKRKALMDIYNSLDNAKAKKILTAKIDTMELLSTVEPDEKKLISLLEMYEYDYASLGKRLVIERVPRTDYLTIAFKSENPYLSATVVNEIGEIFLKFYNSLGSTLSTASVKKISNIVDEKKRQVDSITENLRKLKASQGSLDPAELNKSALQTVSSLTSKLTDEKSDYNRTFYQLQSVNRQLEDLSPSAANSTAPDAHGNNNQEIIRIRTRLKELAPNRDDPKVADQIKKLQDDLKNLQTGSYGSLPVQGETRRASLLAQKSDLEEQLKASEQTIGYLNAEIAKYSSVPSSDAGNDVQINALKTEVEIATKEYSDIKSKYMQAEGFQQTPIINFRQTLVGQPAVEPEPSHTMLLLGIAGFSMLAFCSLIIVLMELLDPSIKSPSRFVDIAGFEPLNPVNKIDLKGTSLKNLFVVGPGQTENGSKNGALVNETLFMRYFRKLRFDLETSKKKVILVTSMRKGEGKTTIIEALSHSLSMINKKVLIIDSNFSNNALTRHFNVEGSLEEWTGSNGNVPDMMRAFRAAIAPTSIRLVDIIGSKGGSYTPDEILPDGNLLSHLSTLAQQYDYVLLEGASLNDNSDSKELSRYVDGILAVFSADSVINHQDKESINFLTIDEKGKFIGSILNKVEKDNIDI